MLEVRNLDVRYGQFLAVRDVSFQINKGDVVSIVGANGAGKTTLLKCISGSITPYSGEINFKNMDITNSEAYQRVGMGLSLVPEGRRLFNDMTVEENLLLGQTVGRKGQWDVEKVMETFPNLVKRRYSKSGKMSGGEQQATAIGRSLMSNPELIILDEVSLGLSPLVVDQVYESIEKLRDSGATIVIVEQDLERALNFSSRTICMLEGKVVLDKASKDTNRDEVTEAYFGINQFENKVHQ